MKKKYEDIQQPYYFIHNNQDYEDLRNIAIRSLNSLIINDFCEIGMATWLIKAPGNDMAPTKTHLIDHEMIDIIANMLC